MNNLIEDFSNITGLSNYTLNHAFSIIQEIIGHYVAEMKLNKQTETVVDLMIGTLTISISDGIKYKFIPNSKLEKTIKKAYKTSESPLTNHIDDTICKSVDKLYKEML